MSRVSCAILMRRSSGRWCSVRMLCTRSASLTRMTRMSSTIASSILRKFSAWRSSLDDEGMDEIRFARMTNLSLVLERREYVGAPEQFDVGIGSVGANFFEEVLEA